MIAHKISLTQNGRPFKGALGAGLITMNKDAKPEEFGSITIHKDENLDRSFVFIRLEEHEELMIKLTDALYKIDELNKKYNKLKEDTNFLFEG